MRQSHAVLADTVLATHVLFVTFVVFGLMLIVVGGVRQWGWVRNTWFRLIHLASIGVVVLQAWLGMICPLTTLEMWLREQFGQSQYKGSFIQHWLEQLLYYDAPTWLFVAAYTSFGLLVSIAWFRYPPRLLGRTDHKST
jgi:hypothetical protein